MWLTGSNPGVSSESVGGTLTYSVPGEPVPSGFVLFCLGWVLDPV